MAVMFSCKRLTGQMKVVVEPKTCGLEGEPNTGSKIEMRQRVEINIVVCFLMVRRRLG